jgi:hypothetical protein
MLSATELKQMEHDVETLTVAKQADDRGAFNRSMALGIKKQILSVQRVGLPRAKKNLADAQDEVSRLEELRQACWKLLPSHHLQAAFLSLVEQADREARKRVENAKASLEDQQKQLRRLVNGVKEFEQE